MLSFDSDQEVATTTLSLQLTTITHHLIEHRSFLTAENMSHKTTSPAHEERNSSHIGIQLDAMRDNGSTSSPTGAVSANEDGSAPTTPALTAAISTKEHPHANDQSTCFLFRLPPEIRNTIYTYALNCKIAQCRCAHCRWDEEHNCPQVNLKHAKPRAPSNELLRTCRRIFNEGKGLFVKAQRDFWSNSTFVLKLETLPLPNSFGYLECLLDVQASHMTRVNIHTNIYGSQPFVVHLRSGRNIQSSVVGQVCTHRSFFPAPLKFIDYVLSGEEFAVDQFNEPLRYQEVLDSLWASRRWFDERMQLCVEHHTEPVCLSVSSMSRAGLMAAVAWTVDGPKCRSTG